MNQRIATLKLRGAALVVTSGVVIGCIVPGCGGDDTVIPVVDSGGPDVTTPVDSGGSRHGRDERRGDDDDARHGRSRIRPGTTSSRPRRRDVHVDAPVDARGDVTVSDAGDARADASDATADVAVEAEAAAPLPPLDLCSTLDVDYGVDSLITGDADSDYSVRATTWGPDISGVMSMNAFVFAWSNDCRANGLADHRPWETATAGPTRPCSSCRTLASSPHLRSNSWVAVLRMRARSPIGGLILRPTHRGHVLHGWRTSTCSPASIVNAVIAQATINWANLSPARPPR